eukprot:s1188_g7.t1
MTRDLSTSPCGRFQVCSSGPLFFGTNFPTAELPPSCSRSVLQDSATRVSSRCTRAPWRPCPFRAHQDYPAPEHTIEVKRSLQAMLMPSVLDIQRLQPTLEVTLESCRDIVQEVIMATEL